MHHQGALLMLSLDAFPNDFPQNSTFPQIHLSRIAAMLGESYWARENPKAKVQLLGDLIP